MISNLRSCYNVSWWFYIDMNKINLDTVVSQSENQVGCNLDKEVVLLNIANGDYYNLDDIASIIWEDMKEAVEVRGLVSNLMEKYSVERSVCEKDVCALLNTFVEDGLVNIVKER